MCMREKDHILITQFDFNHIIFLFFCKSFKMANLLLNPLPHKADF